MSLTLKMVLVLTIYMLTGCLPGNIDDKDKVIPPENANNCSPVANTSTTNNLLAGICLSDFYNEKGNKTSLSETIAQCTLVDSIDSTCTTATLPFIGSNADINDVMSRLIVSDPWMATNFRFLLNKMPEDVLALFASTTAIVIHRSIKPAFFWPITGAIYLDPSYLWITEKEYNSIDKKDDYRQDYSRQFQYVSFNRYVKDGQYAFLDEKNQRGEDQALYALSALLFHELAHAVDNFPADKVTNISSSARPIDILENTISTSEILQSTFILQSNVMKELAAVLYKGQSASPFILSLNAAEVGQYFDQDIATDDYAYSSIYEDTAMAFEEAMMKFHYNIDREVAYVTPNNSAPQRCSDYALDYTAVNRIIDLADKAEWVVNRILPNNRYDSFFERLSMTNKAPFSWCPETTSQNQLKTGLMRSSRPIDQAVIPNDFWH